MTEGRFETTHNLRPKNWDNRRHWTNWHHLYDCEADHIARESAPFHDLRAGGQFQYEYAASGPYEAPIEPDALNRRKAGDRMDFSPGRGTALRGFGDIPLDVEPGRPADPNLVDRLTGMHTKRDPLARGLFSSPPYMPEGGVVDGDGDSRLARTYDGSGGPGMKAGGPVNFSGQPAQYIPDPYKDKPIGGSRARFAVGPIKYGFPEWMPEGEVVRRKKKNTNPPFLAGKTNHVKESLGGDMEWIPDPYDKPKNRAAPPHFRTWHTRTKWSMPVSAPWSTGLATAEPRVGPRMDLTDNNLPSLDTYRKVNKNQTIGSEAALSTVKRPEKVRFK